MKKECKKHGLTEHVLDSSRRWRCKKCRVEGVTRWRQNLKKRAVKYKGEKCVHCGYDKSIAALEFHHPDGKDFGIGQSGHSRSWERVKIELDKCELVCKNCHAEIHWG